MVIPELIRLLEQRGIGFDEAVDIVTRTCAYTNHTILAEALEKWPQHYLEQVVPQLMPIIEKLDALARTRTEDTSTASSTASWPPSSSSESASCWKTPICSWCDSLKENGTRPLPGSISPIFVPGEPFFSVRGRGKNTFRLNFSAEPEARIREGIKRLGGLLKEMAEEKK